jgi:hypothetical protein
MKSGRLISWANTLAADPLVSRPGNAPPAFLERPLNEKVVAQVGQQPLITQDAQSQVAAVLAIQVHKRAIVVAVGPTCRSS